MSEIPSAEQSVNRLVSTMHKIAQSNLPVSVGIGKVLSPPPELKIAWNNIILENKDLYIDQFLLLGYTRNWKGNFKSDKVEGNIKTGTKNKQGGSGKPRYVSHQHKINNSYKSDAKAEYTEDAASTDYGLAAGDIVALFSLEGGQKFIVLGKVIYLPEWTPPADEDSTIAE